MDKREEILDKANTACYYFSDKLKQTVLNAMDIYAQHLLSEKEAEIKRLFDWKESAMNILNTVDLQECAKVLNLPLGSDIAKHILPALKAKEEAIKELLSLIGDNDDVLRYLEDSAHGLEGKKITEQRAANQSLIAKHKQ